MDTVEIFCYYHFATKNSFCISLEEDEFGWEAERIFLPKSVTEIIDENHCVIPLYMAEKIGAI